MGSGGSSSLWSPGKLFMDDSGLKHALCRRLVAPNRVVDPPFRGVQLSQSVNTHVRSLELLVLLTCDLISHPRFL